MNDVPFDLAHVTLPLTAQYAFEEALARRDWERASLWLLASAIVAHAARGDIDDVLDLLAEDSRDER